MHKKIPYSLNLSFVLNYCMVLHFLYKGLPYHSLPLTPPPHLPFPSPPLPPPKKEVIGKRRFPAPF